MNIQTILERESILGLLRLLIEKRAIRRQIVSAINQRAWKKLVQENPEKWPRRVQEDRYEYLVALVHSLDLGIERGAFSKHVLERWLQVFVGNVILNQKYQKQTASSPASGSPLFILISPTGRCNLRCTGCYAASAPDNHGSLDWQTFDRILTEKQELWGSNFTVISGGEPFLWRYGKRDLLDMVAKHASDFFMVYTNGTLINDTVARRMAELGSITPAISVEGFAKETDARRGKGVHQRILRTMEKLRKHGVPFGISATPTRDNWDLIMSDDFVDFYFDQQGALYGWLFQYMPIGRSQSLDLMVTPEQRVLMLERLRWFCRERKVFLADFWNSGTASHGCMSAGRWGGYLYIDWNGDIIPCAFVPYSTDNIYRIYSEGGNLNMALESPFFKRIRAWQDQYGFRRSAERVGNWLCPCVIRDHFESLKNAVLTTGAKPINNEAGVAIQDPAYCAGMLRYGEQINRLTDPMWLGQYLNEPAQRAGSWSRSSRDSGAASAGRLGSPGTEEPLKTLVVNQEHLRGTHRGAPRPREL